MPNEVGTLANEATVISGTVDLDASNNTSTLETQIVTGANLHVTASGAHPGEGEPVPFSVSVWNEGPQSAEGVVVEDLLPAGSSRIRDPERRDLQSRLRIGGSRARSASWRLSTTFRSRSSSRGRQQGC